MQEGSSIGLLYRNRELVFRLICREIDSEFKGSFLGLTWVFARPVLAFCVYTFVFGVIWPHDGDRMPLGAFAMTMLCGLSVYSIFSSAVMAACSSVLSRVSLVKQVLFPLELLPFVQVCAHYILGLAWLLILCIGVLLIFGSLPLQALYIPILLVPLFVITCGIAWFVASLTVYLRDLTQFIPVVLQILMFCTPIFWQLSMMEGDRQKWIPLIYVNPMTSVVESLRDVLIRGAMPDWHTLGVLTLCSVVVWKLGYKWFSVTKKGFADVL